MTQIAGILVTLLSAVMGGILFPLIRSKVSVAQWELIKEFAVAGVQAAEILLGAGNGKEKFEQAKRYIEQQCKKYGIKMDADAIQVAIENAWKALGLDKKSNGIKSRG